MTAPRLLISYPKEPLRGHRARLKRVFDIAEILQDGPCLWSNTTISELDLTSHRLAIVGRITKKCGETGHLQKRVHRHDDLFTVPISDLFEEYWGSYIGIYVDPNVSSIDLIRDPSGSFPLYRAECANHHLFGSDLVALAAGGAPTNVVDWDCLYEHLAAPDIRRKTTCLEGISEIAPGSILHVDSNGTRERLIWSPWDYVHLSRHDPQVIKPVQLCETICESISTWAEPFNHIVVGCSGGLDSSIVCAALARQRHDFSCLTLATNDPSGDERRYAAAVAEATGVRLESFIYDPALINVFQSTSTHLPRPVGQPFMQELERAYRSTVSLDSNVAIFTGNGGDNVFCFLHSAAPIIDRLRIEGSWAGAARTLIEMCQITECSVFTMIRAALRLAHSSAGSTQADRRLLDRSRRRKPTAIRLTPYLNGAPDHAPGKTTHIDLLTRIQNFVEGLDRTTLPWVTSPLLCQPIVEACLAVPTWKWIENGINRSFARQAFHELLPPSIVTRTSKAGPDSVMAAVFEQNRSALRELLLGGTLRDHGLIDACATESALRSPETLRNQMFYRLLMLGEAEAWSRSRMRSRQIAE